MNDIQATPPVARWYPVAALASLIAMALGCAGLVMHMTTDPATLPLDQRALFEAEPAWALIASGIGFGAGLIGAFLLLFRRAAAVPATLVSLIAIVLWLAGLFATSEFRDLLSTDDIAVLIAILAVSWTIYWFARHSRQRGWLR